MKQTNADNDGLKHIYWRSRRGMLELELKLVPFVKQEYVNLSNSEQILYETLLEEEDWQIFDWLQGRAIPEDEGMQQLIAKIQQHRGSL